MKQFDHRDLLNPPEAAEQIACLACSAKLQPGDGHRDVDLQGETFRLCAACWAKVERGGRSPRQTVEAVLLSYDPNFDGGPDDPCDHEDYRDLERLGLWPDRRSP